jgi:hypothetical protein
LRARHATGEEVARQLAVSTTTIHHCGRHGILKRHLYGNNHRCLYEPIDGVQLIAAQLSEQGAS